MTFLKSSYSGHAVKTHVDSPRRMKRHAEKEKKKKKQRMPRLYMCRGKSDLGSGFSSQPVQLKPGGSEMNCQTKSFPNPIMGKTKRFLLHRFQ